MIRRKKFRRPYRKFNLFNLVKFYFIFIIMILIISFLLIIIFGEKKEHPRQETKKINVHKISRSEVFKRGMAIINYVWEFNSEKNGIENNNEIELPYYLKNVSSKKTSGIPYCWGGYISLDISDQKGVNGFEEAIERGYTAGNVNSSGGYKDFTAGLDCSGFVSAVFKLPQKNSTQSLNQYFSEIDIKDLKPMDIFNSEKNHTFIFIRETDDRKGIITMEATTNKYSRTKDKTVINYRSWEEIDKGINNSPYIPMRYKGIKDDEVVSFKDKNEFNNEKKYASPFKLEELNSGYIDYVEDIDYFEIDLEIDNNINLEVQEVPKFTQLKLLDENDNIIMVINEVGEYGQRLGKGKYFIKVEALDYNFNTDSRYAFLLK
jgi:hypothetical protein